jgi:leucine efflux protein
MLGIANPIGYVTIAFLLVLTPGPATVYILSRGYQRGLAAGFVALAGCTAGDICLMSMAALGVAGLLHAYPLLFDIVRWAGAAYLIWLGLKALWPKRQDRQTSITMDAGISGTSDSAAIAQSANADSNRSLSRIFLAGFGVILINPKAILFFMAFFPLFVDPINNRGALTFVALGAIFISMNVCYLGSVMVLGRLMRRRFAGNKGLTLWLSRLTGLAFIGFGVKLATSNLR